MEIHIYEGSTSDDKDALVESITPSYDASCSLSKPKIEEETDHKVINTSVITSKSLCGLVWQDTPSIYSANELLEFPLRIHQVLIEYSDIVSLTVCDVCPPMKSVSLFLGVLPCEYVTLHLPIMYYEISKKIVICDN